MNDLIPTARALIEHSDILKRQAAMLDAEVDAFRKRHSEEQGYRVPMRREDFRRECMK